MLGQNNSRFFSSKSRKGKSNPKPKVNGPKSQSPESPSPIPQKIIPPTAGNPQGRSQVLASASLPCGKYPVPPPIPLKAFPRYSPTSSTPLPSPSMPRKPFLRRTFPFLIVATTAYVLLKSPTKESSQKHEEVKMASSSNPVTSIESPVDEGTAQ